MTFEKLLHTISSTDSPNVCIDSRSVKAGDVFVAIKGPNCDGHDFVPQAIANGAKYIVCEHPLDGVEAIIVPNSARAAAILAQAARGNPASKLINLSVTGTNGKTTVAYLVRSCVQAAGDKCGLIGTVVYDTGAGVRDAALTTPDSLTVAEQQEQMVRAGARYMIIEASSHALDQGRLAGIEFRAAAFTNLTSDHLDYHKTRDNYLQAKAKLFETLPGNATAILNKQSPEAKQIAECTRARILWYAIDEPADITANIKSMDITGSSFLLEYAGRQAKIRTPLLGLHNISNHLAAAGLCLAAGLEMQSVAAGLSGLESVPGRLERVDYNGDFSVFVDFAHTEDAIKNALTALRPLCKGRLIIVFGCGGDRDKTKRPQMAKVSERLANHIIVTSDNPRTEKPEDIISQIVAGFENPRSPNIRVEPDRKKAIGLAIETAGRDDTVLIAGKGHEMYQIIGKTKHHFSDRETAIDFLAGHK